jgi:hypothetical protein
MRTGRPVTSILGIEGLSNEALDLELERGGRFVVFQYVISIIVLTFKRSSAICFVRADQNAALKGLPFTLLTLVAGWWGIPWGPIFTIQALSTNLGGGKDVTAEVVGSLGQPVELTEEEKFSVFTASQGAVTVRAPSGELRTKCQNCGYLNADTRKSCKKCRVPLEPAQSVDLFPRTTDEGARK